MIHRDIENGMVEKNLDLIHDHLRRVLGDARLLDSIPEGAYVFHIPRHDEGLAEHNLQLARKTVAEGHCVVLLPAE